ncbi:MAG: hypothetical protein AB1705_02110 [Verrucomicrobiota bacterium]
MNEANDFTPGEKMIINYYLDRGRRYSRQVVAELFYLIPSIGIFIYAFYAENFNLGGVAFGLILCRASYVLVEGQETNERLSSIIHKYEARLAEPPAIPASKEG